MGYHLFPWLMSLPVGNPASLVKNSHASMKQCYPQERHHIPWKIRPQLKSLHVTCMSHTFFLTSLFFFFPVLGWVWACTCTHTNMEGLGPPREFILIMESREAESAEILWAIKGTKIWDQNLSLSEVMSLLSQTPCSIALYIDITLFHVKVY